MFFRRHKPHVLSFNDWMSKLTSAGFQVELAGAGRAKVRRGGLVAVVEDAGDGHGRIADSGLALGNEIAQLTDQGYQKIFRCDSGRAVAALAEQLRELHGFLEDLRKQLDLASLYNESLGSTNERHLYDRVEQRDEGVPKRPWELKAH